MHLSRFRAFARRAQTELGGADAAMIVVFRYFANEWFDTNGATVEDNALVEKLNRSLLSEQWRERNSRTSFFGVKPLNAVISITSDASTRLSTRQRYAKLVAKIYEDANHEFYSTHDGLTYLLNRDSLVRNLTSLISSGRQSGVHSTDVASESDISTISLIALDLDDFKQINDTYGHQYGDIVLRAFSKIIETVTNDFCDELYGAGRPDCAYVARPSGEEFTIVLGPPLTVTNAVDLAWRIKAALSREPIPSDSDWKLFNPEGAGLIKPQSSARHVTASMGIASSSTTSNKQAEDEAQDLINRADVAMYRAKTGGKNTVRLFSEIISKYGAIIEHHPDTNLVAIDIGSQVGVTIGQEFLVYHPDFDGDQILYSRDERSRKPLGRYPRHPSGRIVVFDVQRTVSFCTVLMGHENRPFVARSTLEAIPVGSIGHLIGRKSHSDALQAAALVEVDSLAPSISDSIEFGGQPAAIVFAISDVESITHEKGSAFVNRLLATLYTHIRDVFGHLVSVAQIQVTELAVLITSAEIELEKSIQSVLDSATEATGGTARFIAGAFSMPEYEAKSSDLSQLDEHNAVEYARYALVVADSQDAKYEVFSGTTASDVVYASRAAGQYVQGLEDYHRLRNLGISYGSFENQGALCARSAEQLPTALECSQRATELSADNPIFWANRGLIERNLGQSPEQSFTNAVALDLEVRDLYVMPIAKTLSDQLNGERLTLPLNAAELWLNAAVTRFSQRGTEIPAELAMALNRVATARSS